MRNTMRLILLVILALSTQGCSYFHRKNCESTNWFEHGKGLALRGQRLSGDDTIEQCRKVEAQISDAQLDLGWKAGQAEYCSPAGAFAAGNKGQQFLGEICNPSDLAKLNAENLKGIRNYCSPESAEEMGRKGLGYNKVCPEDLLKNFMLSYSKGRKSYLTKKVETLKSEIAKERGDLRYHEGSLAAAEKNLKFAEGRLYGLSANASPNEKSNAQSQYDMAQSEVFNSRNKTQSLRSKIEKLEKDLNESEKELAGL